MTIQNRKRKIAEHFKENEFYSKSEDAPEQHYFDKRLIRIASQIREFYECPVHITSTFRTKAHQMQISGTERSAHCLGIAMDFVISEDMAFIHFVDSLRDREFWYDVLRNNGIAGIGIYDSFVHIDTRSDESYPYFNNEDKYGKVSLWGKWWL